MAPDFTSDKSAPKPSDAPKDGIKTDGQSGAASANKDNKENSATSTDAGKNKPEDKDKGPAPAAENNFTQNLKGVPGQSDLTKGGTLAGDKSIKNEAENNLEEKNRILNENSGPNPMPNREGNEITKALQDPGALLARAEKADVDTSGIANEVREIANRNRSSLSNDDRKKFDDIVSRLEKAGK